MSNIIRPRFGARGEPELPAPPPQERRHVHVYGEAAGCFVGLTRDGAGPEGPTLKVVVGMLHDNEIEAVAVVPDTSEGAIDAERAALAILRTLEILEGRRTNPA